MSDLNVTEGLGSGMPAGRLGLWVVWFLSLQRSISPRLPRPALGGMAMPNRLTPPNNRSLVLDFNDFVMGSIFMSSAHSFTQPQTCHKFRRRLNRLMPEVFRTRISHEAAEGAHPQLANPSGMPLQDT